MQRCLGAHDYAIILGMPGTGKTTLIAHAVRAMWALGQSVLLSAYTHSALDNILLKLLEMGVPLLRLGAPQRVHPQLREHTLDALSASAGGTAALQRELAARSVVGTTALALAHAPLWQRTFDVCVVDEAGQTTEPVCLGPLRLSRRFVLVGDHYQLPPLVSEARAAARGLGVSLFQRLSDAHPRAVCRLRRQYRMAADVMAVSNALVYGGQLRCGSEAVAAAALHLPQPTRAPPRRHAADADAGWAEAEAWAAAVHRSGGSAPRTSHWLPATLEPNRRARANPNPNHNLKPNPNPNFNPNPIPIPIPDPNQARPVPRHRCRARARAAQPRAARQRVQPDRGAARRAARRHVPRVWAAPVRPRDHLALPSAAAKRARASRRGGGRWRPNPSPNPNPNPNP